MTDSDSIIRLPTANVRVYVKTPSQGRLFLELDRSTTIEGIKAEIYARVGGLSPGDQKLFYDDKELDDNLTLSAYNIESYSTLKLVELPPRSPSQETFKIFVDSPTGERISLDVTATSMVGDIKDKLAKLLYPSVFVPWPGAWRWYKESMQVLFSDNELKSTLSLSDYNVRPESIFTVKEATMTVHVTLMKPEERRSVSCHVTPSMTIRRIKELIEKKKNIPIGQQMLTVNNDLYAKELSDDLKASLSLYGIVNGTDLYLFQVKRIFIEVPEVGTLKIYCSDSLAISDVKVRVQKLTGIPSDMQQLLFNDKHLDDTMTLSACGVQYGSTLDFVLKLKRGMGIFVETFEHGTTLFDVSPSDTVQSLKEKIQKWEGTPSNHQELQFGRSRLDNNHSTLSSYNITTGSRVMLIKQWIKVGTPTNEFLRVSCVTGRTTVKELKTRIRDAGRKQNRHSPSPNDQLQLLLFNQTITSVA